MNTLSQVINSNVEQFTIFNDYYIINYIILFGRRKCDNGRTLTAYPELRLSFQFCIVCFLFCIILLQLYREDLFFLQIRIVRLTPTSTTGNIFFGQVYLFYQICMSFFSNHTYLWYGWGVFGLSWATLHRLLIRTWNISKEYFSDRIVLMFRNDIMMIVSFIHQFIIYKTVKNCCRILNSLSVADIKPKYTMDTKQKQRKSNKQ